MNKIVSLCGFARAGKDTAAGFIKKTHRRFAYADKLKQDFQIFVEQFFGWDVYNLTDEQKPIIRPYLVAHGAGMRAIKPNHWIEQLDETLKYALQPDAAYCLSDCRYLNEAKDIIENKKGIVIYISRPGCKPANEEEDRSFEEIFQSNYWLDGRIIHANNCGSLEDFSRVIERIVYG